MPILKWRQGEYQALLRLEYLIKNRVTPLLEIPQEQWDFENKVAAKTIDEHLASFGSRLSAKWGKRRCFIDSCHLGPTVKVANGTHHLAWIFELARMKKCQAVPVLGLTRHDDYVAAVAEIVATDGRGACLRLIASDFDKSDLEKAIRVLLSKLFLAPTNVDLLIDSSTIEALSDNEYAEKTLARLRKLPMAKEWRTLTVAGTAFPERLPSTVYRPSGVANRTEWQGYKKLIARAAEMPRLPTFGDYSVAHPKTEMIDPRVIDPTAKIKYSIEDGWFVAVGQMTKKYGRKQYSDLCQRIIKAHPSIFAGATFSWGDDYIANVDTLGTGGSSTWPSVGTNHHITRVVTDLASFHGT